MIVEVVASGIAGCSKCEQAIKLVNRFRNEMNELSGSGVATLKETKGIQTFYVNLEMDRATIIFDPIIASINKIQKRVHDTGLEPGKERRSNYEFYLLRVSGSRGISPIVMYSFC